MMSGKRWRHSVSVADWAARLAVLHGADPGEARRAGLLHDLAKGWSPARLWAYVRRHRVSVPGLGEIRRRGLAGLLHGYVAAHEAGRRGWASVAACHAMAAHTLGRERMSVLDKVLFIADGSSRDRRYPEAAAVRRLAPRDLDGAVRLALAVKIRHVVQRGGYLHPVAVRVWNRLADRA